MGTLVAAAEALPAITDSDEWERAVESLLRDMAEKIETGVMLQADYTKKTQELAEARRNLTNDTWPDRILARARG
jgi:hypothetical protein